MPKKPSNQPI